MTFLKNNKEEQSIDMEKVSKIFKHDGQLSSVVYDAEIPKNDLKKVRKLEFLND